MRRIEASPRVAEQHQRTERLMPHLRAAEDLAYRPLADAEAREQLRSRVEGNEQAVLDAVDWLKMRRDEYIGDRAYRLLLAAATDTPVKPIDPEMASRFAAERELGSLPLEDAFARLAEIEPELRSLADELPGATPGQAAAGREPRDESYVGLVGLSANRDDPLLKSDLAAGIVRQYLMARDARRADVDLRTFYFDSPYKARVFSGSFFGPGRPAARN